MDNITMFNTSKIPLPSTNKKPFWIYYNCARHVEIKGNYFKFRYVLNNDILTVVDESYDTIIRTLLDEYISKNYCQDDEIYQLFVLFFEQDSNFKNEKEYKIEPYDNNETIKYPDILLMVQVILTLIEPEKLPNFLDYHFKKYNGEYAIDFLVHTLDITNGLWKTTIKDIDRQVKFKEWILKTAEYLRQIIKIDSNTLIKGFEEVFLNNREDEILENFKERVHLFFEPIEDEKPEVKNGVYELSLSEQCDFGQILCYEIQESVPRVSNEKSLWIYNNIAELKGIKENSFICEIEEDYEDDGFSYISDKIIICFDGSECSTKTRLIIKDSKYEIFLNGNLLFSDDYNDEQNDDDYDEFLGCNNPNLKGKTGLEKAVFHLYEGWNHNKFAFNILFCDFIEPVEKDGNTYYKIAPKYGKEPDLQIFVEEELKGMARQDSDYQVKKIPYFFQYHCDNAVNIPDFLRNAIKTANNAWGESRTERKCRIKFDEWLYDTIKEYNLDINDIIKPTTGVQPPQSKNKAVTGFDLGFTDEQLTSLYKTLVDEKFLDRKTKLEHFKNAFNGEELKENFKPIKWIKSYYASIFVTHHTEYKTRWLVAETIFDNGNADSLKNGYKEGSLLLSDNQIKCVQLLNSIMKSLQ